MVDEREAEANRVIWIADRFLELHVPRAQAMELALAHADWHKAEDLIRAGCSPRMAAEILKGEP